MSEDVNYNYLDLLNPQQRDAVVYKDGPSLVIAGAGSGKTRVLTYKIVDLLRNGYEPYRILALTFTNKAAREMKDRICGITGYGVASRIWMGTFHSIFLRILRNHCAEIGYQSGFTIYDAADSKSLVKMIIKDLGLDDKIYKPSAISCVISNAKNALVTPRQYMLDRDNLEADKRAKRPMTGQIYSIYCERCRLANAMDFDDILVNMNVLLRDYPDIRRHYQEFFRYILVDEYQDTNFAQHLIITQLTGEQHNLCVVGDDAQSIYSFRGANISNILTLGNRYPGLRIFKLERNYRSTQNIINAAGSLISKNTRQMRKNVYSENEPGEKILVVKTYSDMEEAYMVASIISQKKMTHHDSCEDYAVLYRTNAQSRVLEESLRKRNIPYRIYGGLSFYQRKEIKDIICYFRVAVNPDDDEALRRIINYPARGIGETTMKKLMRLANEKKTSIWKVICGLDVDPDSFNSGTLRKLESFKQMIDTFVEDNRSGSDAFELGQLIYNRTGVLAMLAHDSTPESISRQENLSEMLAGLKDFAATRQETGEGQADMQAFLSEVSLATDQDQTDDDDTPKITLMTVHAAKGLEFKHVIIVGVEEDLFPSAMSMNSLEEVEEERRLLYVAVTRAKLTCALTYAGTRFRNGQTVMTRPSRFLSEIDPRYLRIESSVNYGQQPERPSVSPVSNYRASLWTRNDTSGADRPSVRTSVTGIAAARKLTPVSQVASHTVQGGHSVTELSVGTVIRHNRFGKGQVIKIDEISGEDVITVDFGVVGIKRLILKFAKFDIL